MRPLGCRYLNYEGEVAVIVGRRLKRGSVEDALDAAGKVLNTSDHEGKIREFLDSALAEEGDTKIDYDRDVKPWLGERAALWLASALQMVGVSVFLLVGSYPGLLLGAAVFGLGMGGLVPLWGTLIGALFPVVLKRLGLDPAVSSAPLVATFIDVTGILLYFNIAMLLLKDRLL